MKRRYYMKDNDRGFVELRRVEARTLRDPEDRRDIRQPEHFIVTTNGHEVSRAEFDAMRKAGQIIEVKAR